MHRTISLAGNCPKTLLRLGHHKSYRLGFSLMHGFLNCCATVGLCATFRESSCTSVQIPLQHGLTWQECSLAVVADAKEPCSFFACKITC